MTRFMEFGKSVLGFSAQLKDDHGLWLKVDRIRKTSFIFWFINN